MALFNIYIREPTYITHTPPFLPVFINLEVGFLLLIIGRNFEPEMSAVIA